MSGPPDPHADADYRALVEALAREGLPRRTEAVRAVEAVICALARRLDDPAFDSVRERLPEPFRSRLVACERHALVVPRDRWGAEEFYEAVQDDLGHDTADVEPTVRAVVAAVRGQLPEDEADDVLDLLPPDLQALWRRPS
jgi:uncharacterized protein (DUF2267 family)